MPPSDCPDLPTAAPNPVASALTSIRRNLGLSQAQVAARMRTSQAALSTLEAGTGQPRYDTLQRWAGAVGMHLDFSLSPEQVGDSTGVPGLRTAAGTPVLLDPFTAGQRDMAPGTLIIGPTGSGKTLLLRQTAAWALEAGLSVLALTAKPGPGLLDSLPDVVRVTPGQGAWTVPGPGQALELLSGDEQLNPSAFWPACAQALLEVEKGTLILIEDAWMLDASVWAAMWQSVRSFRCSRFALVLSTHNATDLKDLRPFISRVVCLSEPAAERAAQAAALCGVLDDGIHAEHLRGKSGFPALLQDLDGSVHLLQRA